MITEVESQAELKSIVRLIGAAVRHSWERYEATEDSEMLAILSDLDKAKNAITSHIKMFQVLSKDLKEHQT